jgi:hypothetical protein
MKQSNEVSDEEIMKKLEFIESQFNEIISLLKEQEVLK